MTTERRWSSKRPLVKQAAEEQQEEKLPPVILGESGPTQAGWHSIEAFLRCPKEFQFATVRGIRQPQTMTPEPLAVGALFHAGRARWFSLRFASDEKAWASITAAVQEEAANMRLPTSLAAEQRAMNLLNQYVDHYSKRVRPTPVAAEYLVGPASVDGTDPFAMRTARLDDVSKYPEAGNKLCIGESKTTSTSVADTVNQYTLHGQPLLQILLWKHAPQGEAMHGPVAGVVLDVVVKPYGKNKKATFGRQFVPVSEHALAWYAQSLRGYLRAAAGVDWNAAAPRNVSACTRLIGRGRFACPFRDLCTHGRSAAAQYVLADGSALHQWKPSEGKEVAPWM